MRKGISPLISYVIVLGIVIMGVGIVVSTGLPLIDQMRDTAATETAVGNLQSLYTMILDVSAGSKFTTQTIQFIVRRGAYHIRPEEDEVYFEITSQSDIISSQSSREIGAVTLSANTGVSLEKTDVGGIECFMMENSHIEACIRAVEPNGTGDPAINTSGLLVHYRNKDLDRTLTQNLSVVINGNASSSSGTGYTVAERVDDDLGRARVTAHIENQVAAYNVTFDLLNGADFLSIKVE